MFCLNTATYLKTLVAYILQLFKQIHGLAFCMEKDKL